jgi:hypothetical protein
MRISPNNAYVKKIMENLMKEAFIDVTPTDNEIYLMVPQQNGGKSHKKKKLNIDGKFVKGKTHVSNLSFEQNVCIKALECLAYMLVYHGVLMKPVLFYIMQEKITSIAFAVSAKVQQDSDLYRDPTCRSRLSDLIGFMMIHPVPKMPVPINYGIALLTKMKHSDSDANVRDVAAMNLYRAETAVHNRKDVFYFPSDYRDLRDTLMFNKQTVQKFNAPIEKTTNELLSSNIIEEHQSNNKMEVENVLIPSSDSEDESNDLTKNNNEQEPQTEVNEISDDDEDAVIETTPEISEPETIRRSSRKPMPSEKKLAAVSEKRTSPVAEAQVSPKKQKVSNQKEEDMVEEYLADFIDM